MKSIKLVMMGVFALSTFPAATYCATAQSPILDPKLGLSIQHGNVRGILPYSYDVVEQAGSSNSDVVYFFHGAEENASQLENVLLKIQDEALSQGQMLPRFVSVSFGPLWFVYPKSTARQSGIQEKILKQVFPFVENKLLSSTPSRRHVLGLSMGGFNALLLTLSAPQKFATVTLWAPAFFPLGPYATERELKSYSQESGVPLHRHVPGKLDGIEELLPLAKIGLGGPKVWNKIDPWARVLAISSESKKDFPAITIIGDQNDDVFFYGDRLLFDSMKKVGLNVRWEVCFGDHGDISPDNIHDLPFWKK